MTDFKHWCDRTTVNNVDKHVIENIVSCDDDAGISLVSATLAEKYAEVDMLLHIAKTLGKEKVSAFLENKFPTTASARSGDLGEILATAYLHEDCGYVVGPSRLIDRDHQQWAMRGDDVLGVVVEPDTGVHLAKVEAKSGKRISKKVVTEARKGLERCDGLPSSHSLSQFAERLRRASHDDSADAVLRVQLDHGIRPEIVNHMMFLFTMSDPTVFVKDDLAGYTGSNEQRTVTLRVSDHPQFIGRVFAEALADDT